jgi:hypothetical protein
LYLLTPVLERVPEPPELVVGQAPELVVELAGGVVVLALVVVVTTKVVLFVVVAAAVVFPGMHWP